jgi:hypothetical protein
MQQAFRGGGEEYFNDRINEFATHRLRTSETCKVVPDDGGDDDDDDGDENDNISMALVREQTIPTE